MIIFRQLTTFYSVAVLRWGQAAHAPKFCQANLGLTLPHVNRLRWKLFKC